MSAYKEVLTQFKDGKILKAALEAVGNGHGASLEGKVEMFEEAQNLYGYQSDLREQKANIVIRKEHVGPAANDVGFEKVDGLFVARISDYDSKGNKCHSRWLGLVRQEYATLRTMAKARRQGYKVSRTKTPEGKIKLVCRR
tara:strand:+ start:122 stop:544 length:423 start_codon:yes stop_codon:yes gene_type:complete